MIDVHFEKNRKEASSKAAGAVSDFVSVHQEDDILLLFSGGSPLEILTHLPTAGFDSRITVGVSDDRFSTDPGINNFAQIMATDWFKSVSENGVNYIDTRPQPGDTVLSAGVRFDHELKSWKVRCPEGKLVITQGIGLDGHTAGMMPYLEHADQFERMFVNTGAWAVGYDAGSKNKYPLRVTTTIPFLTQADLSVLYVCGLDKLIPLKHALESSADVHAVPGRMIHMLKHCLLYTDQSVDTVSTV